MAEMPDNTPSQAKQTIKLKPLSLHSPLKPGNAPAPGAATVRLSQKEHPEVSESATRKIPLMKPMGVQPASLNATATKSIPLMKVAASPAPAVPGNTASRPIPMAVGTDSRPLPKVGTASRPIPKVNTSSRPIPKAADPGVTATAAIPLMKPAPGVPAGGEQNAGAFEQTQTVRLHRPLPKPMPPREAKVAPSAAAPSAAAAPGAKTIVLAPPPKAETSTVAIKITGKESAVPAQEEKPAVQPSPEENTVSPESPAVSPVKTPTLKLTPPPSDKMETLIHSQPAAGQQTIKLSAAQTQELAANSAQTQELNAEIPPEEVPAPEEPSAASEAQEEVAENEMSLEDETSETSASSDNDGEPGIIFTIISSVAAAAVAVCLALFVIQYCNFWQGTSIRIPGLSSLSFRK